MTYTQPPLLDAPATRGSSRKRDPRTSRDAGRSMTGTILRDQQWMVLYFADRAGRSRDGATAWETWVVGGGHQHSHAIKENVISKRFGELRDLGLLRLTGETRPGSSHRLQQVHVVTDAGAEVLRNRSAA